jgi:hypothetical protein
MRMFVSLAAAAALAAGLSIGAQTSQAITLSFFNISNNSGVDVAGQLSALVEDVGGDASFTFFNDVGIDSSVTAVYFDDDVPLLGSATITSSGVGPSVTAVNFSEGATPSNLPGGAAHSFSATYSADSDTPPPENGINEATDWLTIVFDLLAGMSFTDVTAALMNGDLRIGMQVQSIAGGGANDSDQFLNNPAPIPLPAGLLLFLSGLVGIGFLGRYKAKRSEPAAV